VQRERLGKRDTSRREIHRKREVEVGDEGLKRLSDMEQEARVVHALGDSQYCIINRNEDMYVHTYLC
jgi:hypothetical protein